MHPGLILFFALAGTASAVVVGSVVVDRMNAPEPAPQQQATQEQTSQEAETPSTEPTPLVAAEEAPPSVIPTIDIVRVEPSGEVLIAGTAEPGARIGLLYNDTPFADTLAELGGDFVLVPLSPLPSGEGTLQVTVTDEAGNVLVIAQEQVAVMVPQAGSQEGFLVGIVRPDQPIEIIERQAPQELEAAAPPPVVEVAARITPRTPQAAPEAAPLPQLQIAARITPQPSVEPEPQPSPEVAAAPLPQLQIAARIVPQAAAPEPVIAPENFVLLDAIELEGQRVWIAGGALPDAIIRLYQDNVFLGQTEAGEQGRFLFEGTLNSAQGEVIMRADALAQGSADVLARAQVPFDMPASETAVAPPPALEVAARIVPRTSAPVETAAAPVETAAAPADAERVSLLDTGRVIIRRGDNLWRLSRRVYGQGIRYTSIYDANRDQIGEPELIYPGQVFTLPQPQAEWGDVPGVQALEPDQIPAANPPTASSN